MNRTKLIFLLLVITAVPAIAQNSYNGHSEKMYSAVHPRYTLASLDEMGLDEWQDSFRSELRSRLGIPVIEASLEGTDFKPSATYLRSEDDGTMVREWWEMTTEPDVVMKFIVIIKTGHGHSFSHI